MNRMLLAVMLLMLTGLPQLPAQEAKTNAAMKATLTDDQLGELLQQAIMLGRVGLYDEAEATCEKILAQRPDQTTVKQLLAEIEDARHKAHGQDPGYDLKRQLGKLKIPALEVREAAAQDVLEYLRKESAKVTPDKKAINIVWTVPADVVLPKVTLSLTEIPLLDAVRYVCEATKVKMRVDARAVVIYLPEPASPAPKPAEPNAQP